MPKSSTGAGKIARETQDVAIKPQDPAAADQKYGVVFSGTGRRRTSAGRSDDRRRRARKDRDKLLYSGAWRRLAGVTQVVSPDGESAVLHTRLTHSEKVAQVAWSMANHILADPDMAEDVAAWGGIDLDVVETAALAHDLGHPPFGHIAEPILDKFARDLGLVDGFEGNAQSFRVVTNLIKWTPSSQRGAALSRGSLAAILKYPWSRHDTVQRELPGTGKVRATSGGGPRVAAQDGSTRTAGAAGTAKSRAEGNQGQPVTDRGWEPEDFSESAPPKFGYYDSENAHFVEARSWVQEVDGTNTRYSQTLEASIMDLADDVTYAFHDFEDFVLSGAFDIHALLEQARSYIGPGLSGVWFERLRDKLARKYPEYNERSYNKAVGTFYNILGGAVSGVDGPIPTREDTSSGTTSGLLDTMIPSVQVTNRPDWDNGPLVRLGDDEWHLVAVMKAVTLDYIVLAPSIAVHQRSQQRMLRELCREVAHWAIAEPERLPSPLKEQLTYADLGGDDLSPLSTAVRDKLVKPHESEVKATRRQQPQTDTAPPERYLVDFVAGLSDFEAKSLHRRLTGNDQAPIHLQSYY